jgi:microcystin-dependent protein
MAEPLLGEIRTFAFGFTPNGWAPCEGQLLPINQNQALFALLGTTYGGDGQTTFALPDLRGRVVVGAGTAEDGAVFPAGDRGGAAAHRLSSAEMPRHRHRARASRGPGSVEAPDGAVWAGGPRRFAPDGAEGLDEAAIDAAGGNRPHSSMQPYLALNTCIALLGEFPPRP